jgi:MFS family permease
MLAALFVGGVLSDKFGRRNIWYGSGIIILIATWSMIYPKFFVVFIVCRIFIGIGSGTVCTYPTILFVIGLLLFYKNFFTLHTGKGVVLES